MTVISKPAIATPSGVAALRALAPMLAAVFAVDSMTALVVIAYGNTYLINNLGAPPSYPAYALAIYGFVKLASAPIGGRVLDRVRTPAVVALACALDLGGFATILVTHSAEGYLGGVAILSTGIALAWLVVFHAVGAASDPSGRGAATAYMGLTSIVATATGFGVAALIGETRYWQAAFSLGIVLAAVSSAALLRLQPADAGIEALAPGGEPVATPGERRNLRRLAFVVVLAHFAVITATLGAFGPLALRTLNLSILQAGLLLAPAAVVGAAAMYLAGIHSRQGRRLRELALLYALGGAALLALSGIGSPILFALAAVPFAIAIGGSQPLMNASLIDAARSGDRTGAALGWLFFAEGLGSVVGPAAIGTTIEFASVRVALVGLGATVLALAAVAAGASRSVRL